MEQLTAGTNSRGAYYKSVFINCPFDKAYVPLRDSAIFTILACGFQPRIALERSNAAELRLQKIKSLILDSRLSVHDLSRLKSSRKDEFYRLNMPLELGLDLGCASYHAACNDKQLLLLVAEPHTHQRAISDLAGVDVEAHNDSPEELMIILRNWLSLYTTEELNGGAWYWNKYNIFLSHFYASLMSRGYSDREMQKISVPDFIQEVSRWLELQ
jgi:hypothetical protein